MTSFLTRITGDKAQWKAMEARAHALPRDYRTVYGEVKSFLWKFATGDGRDVLARLEEVLAVFETGAAQGRDVRDVTGEDVATFSLGGLQRPRSVQDGWRATLNDDVARKLPR